LKATQASRGRAHTSSADDPKTIAHATHFPAIFFTAAMIFLLIRVLFLFFFAAIGVAAKSSDARGFPSDPLNVATRDADIGQLAFVQAIQLAKTFVVPTPNPKHPNQARDEIHSCLLFRAAVSAALPSSSKINRWRQE
jgi:hypothetical protein